MKSGLLGARTTEKSKCLAQKGGFETEGVVLINGGEVMAIGNKNTKPDSKSTQYCICLKDEHSYASGEVLSLTQQKENGMEVLIEGTIPHDYLGKIHIIFSSRSISKENTYEIRKDDKILKSIKVCSLITDYK